MKKDQLLAYASVVDNDKLSDNIKVDVNLITNNARSENSEIEFDLSKANLDEGQKDKLKLFLKDKRNVFASNLHELGETNIYKQIDTGDDPPVRMPFYRQLPDVRSECSRQIKDMLEAKIIEKSHSDWRSPVVM